MTLHDNQDNGNGQQPNGNGIMGKVRTVSPFIVFGAGALLAFSGSYVGGLQHNASSEAEIKQVLVQHDEAIRALRTEQEALRHEVVPRSEHDAMLKENEEIAHWIEKYNDAMQSNLQHEIDSIKEKTGR